MTLAWEVRNDPDGSWGIDIVLPCGCRMPAREELIGGITSYRTDESGPCPLHEESEYLKPE